MKKGKILLIAVSILFFCSCNDELKQTNSELPINMEAIQISNHFMYLYFKKQFDSCIFLTKGITNNDIAVGANYGDSALGVIESFNYKKIEVNHSFGTEGKSTTIKTFYELIRSKKNCYRIIYLEYDKTLKIVGYDDKFTIK